MHKKKRQKKRKREKVSVGEGLLLERERKKREGVPFFSFLMRQPRVQWFSLCLYKDCTVRYYGVAREIEHERETLVVVLYVLLFLGGVNFEWWIDA